ncbi:hypothetical protein KTJ53_12905 [Acinetobacter variabilis]|uniref:hypothetical protein n=1 Tax=Acinetobacter TaxID=469 RepID=UPI0015D1059E|nr:MULTISPECIES: hypothetical protein [Acinetobacter]MCU4630572.1 hypothetical protein [Acinetobacter variabilis]
MSNQNVAFEVNGGGRNKFSDVNIMVKGEGKGFVLNDTSDNEFKNIEVFIEKELSFFNDLKSALEKIDDNSINSATNKPFKEETIGKINSIIELQTRDNLKSNTAELIGLLGSWITIQSFLFPQIWPYIAELQKIL